MPKWTYCNCTGTHAKGCPNAGNPDTLPPLADDDDNPNSN